MKSAPNSFELFFAINETASDELTEAQTETQKIRPHCLASFEFFHWQTNQP